MSWQTMPKPTGIPRDETDYESITTKVQLPFNGKVKDVCRMEMKMGEDDDKADDLRKIDAMYGGKFSDGTQIDGDLVVLKRYYREYAYKDCMHPKVRSLFERIGHRQRTTTWRRVRRTKITASQFCCVLAHSDIRKTWLHRFRSRYRNRETLTSDKLREEQPESNNGKHNPENTFKNMVLNHGVVNEAVAIKRAIELLNIPILHEIDENGKIDAVDFGLLEHPRYSCIAGSPDGVCIDGSLVEVKCPWSEKKQTSMKAGYVPDQYFMQMQILMDIMDLPRAYFINYCPPSITQKEKCCVSVVKRNRDLFKHFILPIAMHYHKSFMILLKQGFVEENMKKNENEKKELKKVSKSERDHENYVKEVTKAHPSFAIGSHVRQIYVDANKGKPGHVIHSYKIVENDKANGTDFNPIYYGCL